MRHFFRGAPHSDAALARCETSFASPLSRRAAARASRAIASSSRASLNEDDKDGGKTIEIIEANLVRARDGPLESNF